MILSEQFATHRNHISVHRLGGSIGTLAPQHVRQVVEPRGDLRMCLAVQLAFHLERLAVKRLGLRIVSLGVKHEGQVVQGLGQIRMRVVAEKLAAQRLRGA